MNPDRERMHRCEASEIEEDVIIEAGKTRGYYGSD
jgi:hypothetical protein